MTRRAWVAAGATFACALGLAAPPALADAPGVASLRWAGPSDPTRYVALVGDGDAARRASVWIATHGHTRRGAADLAYARLAEALGVDVVPRTQLGRVRVGELLAAAAGDATTLSHVKTAARVLNDGTVPFRSTDLPPGAREVPVTSAEARRWTSWIEGEEPVPQGAEALASAWAATLVLDYVAADATRRSVHVADDGHALWLVDNAGAFVEHPSPATVAPLLDRLRNVTRFPRRLVVGLRAFDRARAESIWHAGPYASWLVAARPLGECLERARAALSLVEARVVERGEAAVLADP